MPSQLRRIRNSLAAYQFDNAVLFTGATIESALLERMAVGKESVPRYTIEQLLDPAFRLQPMMKSFGGVKALAAANPEIVGRWKQAPKAM